MLSQKVAKALIKSGEQPAESLFGSSDRWRDLQRGDDPGETPNNADVSVTSTLEVIVGHARYATRADGAAIALREGDRIVCRASRGYAPEPGVALDPNSGISGRCFSTGEVIVWSGPEHEAAAAVSSVVAIPIRVREQVQGLVAVFSKSSHAFTAEHVAALTRVCDAVSRQLADPQLDDAPVATPCGGANTPLPTTATVASVTSSTFERGSSKESERGALPKAAEENGKTTGSANNNSSSTRESSKRSKTRWPYLVLMVTAVLIIAIGALLGVNSSAQLSEWIHLLFEWIHLVFR